MKKRIPTDFLILMAYSSFILFVLFFSNFVYKTYDRYRNKNSESVGLWEKVTHQPNKTQKNFEDGVDIEQLNHSKLELLNSYRWIDKKQKIVAVPIERAMDELVKGAP